MAHLTGGLHHLVKGNDLRDTGQHQLRRNKGIGGAGRITGLAGGLHQPGDGVADEPQ